MEQDSSGYEMRGLQGRVIDAIGQLIVGGTYPPGSSLPREAELVEEYGVSRTSVREAMKVLSAKGLVEIRPKTGTRVRPKELWNSFDSDLLTWHYAQGLGAEVMQDLIELRQILEPAAARLAAGRATIADIRRLEVAHAEMASAADDPAHYAAHDVAFHLGVYGASHNALLNRFGLLVADFLELSFEVQQAAAVSQDSTLDYDVDRHAKVLDAINRADSEGAAAAMLDVVLDGKSALIAAFSEN